MILYHFTQEKNLKNILSKGLMPSERNEIYLTDIQNIEKNPGYWLGYGNIVLEINIPRSWVCVLGKIHDFHYGKYTFEMYHNNAKRSMMQIKEYLVCRKIPVNRIVDILHYKAY